MSPNLTQVGEEIDPVARRIPLPHEILSKSLKLRIKKNPSYSLRALARQLKISAPYLSRILKGEKSFPQERFEQFAQALDMDEYSRLLLQQSLLQESVKSKRAASKLVGEMLQEGGKSGPSPAADYEEMSPREFWVLDAWYYLPILDLVTTVDFKADGAWVAERLGIPYERARVALQQLIDQGLIDERDGAWRKVSDKIHFPTARSHPSVRRYHKQMIEKSVDLLLTDTDDESFNRRLITGLSFSGDPSKLPKARERLMNALFEVADILASGECTEVFQINAQLFPLTQRRPRKNK